MNSHRFASKESFEGGVSRRTFVKGLAVGGAVAGLGLWRTTALAQGIAPVAWTTLSGTEFDLRIGETPMNFTGSPRVAITVNGSVPAPTLRWKEGDTVTMRVANTLAEDASIHWHGILLPANMDGVPGLSFHGIRPGETYVYRFEVRQAGTYWYHSHSGFQEQRGLYGPLIIEPREPSPFKYDREHVVMLTDWTDENPARVFAKLRGCLEQLESPVRQPPLLCVRHQVSNLRFLSLGRRAGCHLCPVISQVSSRRRGKPI